MLIEIANNGKDIKETNYWDSRQAQAGYAYLSMNAGALRLLLPPRLESALEEMRTAKEVIVSRGPWADYGDRDAVEVLFEDMTNEPFLLQLVAEQVDMLPSKKRKNLVFSVWTREGKQLELPAKFRKVSRIPYMKPW